MGPQVCLAQDLLKVSPLSFIRLPQVLDFYFSYCPFAEDLQVGWWQEKIVERGVYKL